MTPGARIQTAIELLELILKPPAGREDVPADTVVSGYLRGRRYIGSKDRRAINGLVFGVLRHRAEVVQDASGHIQHMQKSLDQMNLQLHHVISELAGMTGLAILDAILAGERDRYNMGQRQRTRP